MNTDSLVEEAIRLKQSAATARQPYNEIWCVLDRDNFPPANYGRAFDYDYQGPYYGGPYVGYWWRLPYACGVYGYC